MIKRLILRQPEEQVEWSDIPCNKCDGSGFERKNKKKRGKKYINDMSGLVYGNWLVLRIDENQAVGDVPRWICECKCGYIKSVAGSDLRDGRSQRCMGCKLKWMIRGGPTNGLDFCDSCMTWRKLGTHCSTCIKVVEKQK